MQQRSLIRLAAITLFLFGLLGIILIPHAQKTSIQLFIGQGHHPALQILEGVLAGLVIAFIGWKIITLDYLRSSLDFFVDIIQPMNLGMNEILFVSMCAGIGEELFFRGAIQGYLGVWPTAVLFVAIHGYLHPRKRIFFYGLFMTIAMVVVGYMAYYFGIISAIASHVAIDAYLLYKLARIRRD